MRADRVCIYVHSSRYVYISWDVCAQYVFVYIISGACLLCMHPHYYTADSEFLGMIYWICFTTEPNMCIDIGNGFSPVSWHLREWKRYCGILAEMKVVYTWFTYNPPFYLAMKANRESNHSDGECLLVCVCQADERGRRRLCSLIYHQH